MSYVGVGVRFVRPTVILLLSKRWTTLKVGGVEAKAVSVLGSFVARLGAALGEMTIGAFDASRGVTAV